MNKFGCFKCHKKSRYLRRVGGLKWEARFTGGFTGGDETRTYECERCKAENQITNSKLEWMLIDAESASS